MNGAPLDPMDTEKDLVDLQHRRPDFTPQELRIARLLRQGKTSAEIADRLGLTEPTLGWHRKNMRRKLGIDHSQQSLLSALLSLDDH